VKLEITEEDVARIALEVGSERNDGLVTFDALRLEVPLRYRLSATDMRQSLTRPREKIWEQKIRNIKSHSDVPGNYICEGYLVHVPGIGYQVTSKGLSRVRRHAA
jgi:hypothetical protein